MPPFISHFSNKLIPFIPARNYRQHRPGFTTLIFQHLTQRRSKSFLPIGKRHVMRLSLPIDYGKCEFDKCHQQSWFYSSPLDYQRYASECERRWTKRGPISIPKRLVAGFACHQNANRGVLYHSRHPGQCRNFTHNCNRQTNCSFRGSFRCAGGRSVSNQTEIQRTYRRIKSLNCGQILSPTLTGV